MKKIINNIDRIIVVLAVLFLVYGNITSTTPNYSTLMQNAESILKQTISHIDEKIESIEQGVVIKETVVNNLKENTTIIREEKDEKLDFIDNASSTERDSLRRILFER